MGVGGSTNRPGSAENMVLSRPPSLPTTRRAPTQSASSRDNDRPTGSCCSHFRKNHATLTRTVTPATVTPPHEESIDDEIEAIVANTLDLVSDGNHAANNIAKNADSNIAEPILELGGAKRDREGHSSAAGSGIELRRTIVSNTRVAQKRPSDDMSEQDEPQYDAKENVPEVDFAKFKKVNHKGTTISANGRIIHHQESDLLWRLGLISPEAYKMNTGPRSAPSNQGPFKTPSYDLTEEQLMANIEKEFECTTAI